MSNCRGRRLEIRRSPWKGPSCVTRRGDTGQRTRSDGLLHAHVKGVAHVTQPGREEAETRCPASGPVSTPSAPRGLGNTLCHCHRISPDFRSSRNCDSVTFRLGLGARVGVVTVIRALFFTRLCPQQAVSGDRIFSSERQGDALQPAEEWMPRWHRPHFGGTSQSLSTAAPSCGTNGCFTKSLPWGFKSRVPDPSSVTGEWPALGSDHHLLFFLCGHYFLDLFKIK